MMWTRPLVAKVEEIRGLKTQTVWVRAAISSKRLPDVFRPDCCRKGAGRARAQQRTETRAWGTSGTLDSKRGRFASEAALPSKGLRLTCFQEGPRYLSPYLASFPWIKVGTTVPDRKASAANHAKLVARAPPPIRSNKDFGCFIHSVLAVVAPGPTIRPPRVNNAEPLKLGNPRMAPGGKALPAKPAPYPP